MKYSVVGRTLSLTFPSCLLKVPIDVLTTSAVVPLGRSCHLGGISLELCSHLYRGLIWVVVLVGWASHLDSGPT